MWAGCTAECLEFDRMLRRLRFEGDYIMRAVGVITAILCPKQINERKGKRSFFWSVAGTHYHPPSLWKATASIFTTFYQRFSDWELEHSTCVGLPCEGEGWPFFYFLRHENNQEPQWLRLEHRTWLYDKRAVINRTFMSRLISWTVEPPFIQYRSLRLFVCAMSLTVTAMQATCSTSSRGRWRQFLSLLIVSFTHSTHVPATYLALSYIHMWKW